MKKLMFAMAIAATVGFAQADTEIGTTTDFDNLVTNTTFSTAVDQQWTNNTDTEGPVEEATVKAYDPADVDNPNYLALDGVQNLAKKINTAIGDGLYIDTMVKFTATEDDAPTPGEGDKLVVWLKETPGENDNPSTYKLMVTAGYIDTEHEELSTKSYETTASVQPDTWYNLKVKAIENVDTIDATDGTPGFVVFIDGTAVVTEECPADLAEFFGTTKYVDEGNNSYSIFPSMVGGLADNGTTITQLAFSGSGAIDTVGAFQGDCDPDAPTPTEDWVDPTDAEAMAEITGKTVAEVYPTLATSLSANLQAADAGKLTKWATGVGDVDFADAAGINETAFLLGVANDETDLTLEPASIEIVNGKVVISANKDLEDVNGKVYIKTADDLDDLASAAWAEANLDKDGAVSLDAVEDASFYKIKVDF